MTNKYAYKIVVCECICDDERKNALSQLLRSLLGDEIQPLYLCTDLGDGTYHIKGTYMDYDGSIKKQLVMFFEKNQHSFPEVLIKELPNANKEDVIFEK